MLTTLLAVILRVTACLKNLEKSENSKVVRENENVREK